MFEQLIHESRARIAKSRSSLLRRLGLTSAANDLDPRDDIPREFRPHCLELLRSGAVVWGSIAQANNKLFSPGDEDLPANTVYSPSAYFDGNPGHLIDVAHAVFQLKNTSPEDRELAIVAATITDEYNRVDKERLPSRLTDGHEVYLATTIVHRSRLPDGILSDSVFPLLIYPRKTPANMILPLPYWSRQHIELWGELDEIIDQTPRQHRVVSPIGSAQKKPTIRVEVRPPANKKSVALISLTPAAVRTVRELANTYEVQDQFYLSDGVTESDAGYRHSVELAESWDRDCETCFESSGIKVLVSKAQIQLLAGSVVDYRKSVYGSGFVVRNPNV